MAISFESGYRSTLAAKLNATDITAEVVTAPTVTAGRMHVYKGNTHAWIKYTGVTGTTLTGVSFVSPTADPATTVTGTTFVAGTSIELVEMQDQMIDKQTGSIVAVYATTAARDLALPTPANGMTAYITADGLFTDYIAGAWSNRATGSVANSSTTVAGKVETATTAESIAGTDTGGTGANLFVLPSNVAKNTQSGTFVYGADVGGDDTYVVALTPTLTAYTTGQELVMNVTTANTGACTVDFGPGPKSIVMPDGSNPVTGSIQGIVPLRYNGTNFVVQGGITLNTLTPNTVEVETYATHEVPLSAISGSAMAGWTSVALTCTQSAAGFSNLAGSSPAWYTFSAVGGSGSTDGFTTAAGKTIRIKWRMRFPALSTDCAGFGLAGNASNISSIDTDTNVLARFVNNGGVLYAHNANGTVTKTNVSSGITLTDYNTYMIVFTPGSQILYYINGTLVATHTTNLPTGAMTLAIGVLNNARAIYCFPPIVSTQL